MPLAPEYAAMFEQLAQQDPAPPIYELPTQDARALYRAMRPVMDALPAHQIENRSIPGTLGDIPVRIYTPEGDGPFGVPAGCRAVPRPSRLFFGQRYRGRRARESARRGA